jgi:alginate O-acetyltransferase complex protein AlgI
MAVFFICGLWHGANWTFVVWGLWHGSFLVLERMKWLRFKVISPVKHIYALLVIMVGWVFFRADSIIHALGYIKSMFGFELGTTAYDASIYLSPVIVIVLIVAIIGSLPVIPWLSRLKQRLASRWSFIDACYSVALVSSLLGIFVLSVIEIASGYYQPFLYGQF